MALRDKDSIYADTFNPKVTKAFIKQAMLILDNYDEDYLRKERERIIAENDTLKEKISEQDFNKTNDGIKAKMAANNTKLKMFNYLLLIN